MDNLSVQTKELGQTISEQKGTIEKLQIKVKVLETTRTNTIRLLDHEKQNNERLHNNLDKIREDMKNDLKRAIDAVRDYVQSLNEINGGDSDGLDGNSSSFSSNDPAISSLEQLQSRIINSLENKVLDLTHLPSPSTNEIFNFDLPNEDHKVKDITKKSQKKAPQSIDNLPSLLVSEESIQENMIARDDQDTFHG
mmetsp:Transcript_38427/g.50636  ORF Transcript_38427/g.50636 Transcript_38427/m.50636 type:complete len:195 (+) Transcript_38427:1379-1963(+)